LVNVAASADGYVVGEELEGDYFENWEQELGGLGIWMVCSTGWLMSPSPSIVLKRAIDRERTPGASVSA
jgi:hypothetical protein